MRVYKLKNCSNFQQLLPKVSEEWASARLLIGIDLPPTEAEYRSTDLNLKSINGQNIHLLPRKCALFVIFDAMREK
jgi:hypothetical protein